MRTLFAQQVETFLTELPCSISTNFIGLPYSVFQGSPSSSRESVFIYLLLQCSDFRAIIMDRFSLISSQMSQLAKAMKNDRFQDFRKIAIVPYLVSQDPDPAVEVKIAEAEISHDSFIVS